MLHCLSTNLTGVLLIFIMQRPSQHAGCWETDNPSIFFFSVSSLLETQPTYRVISGLAVSDIMSHTPISLFPAWNRPTPNWFLMQYVGIPAWVHSAVAAASEDYKDPKPQYGNMPDEPHILRFSQLH